MAMLETDVEEWRRHVREETDDRPEFSAPPAHLTDHGLHVLLIQTAADGLALELEERRRCVAGDHPLYIAERRPGARVMRCRYCRFQYTHHERGTWGYCDDAGRPIDVCRTCSGRGEVRDPSSGYGIVAWVLCPDCDVSVFDDGGGIVPPPGHSDPYCARIAPWGSPEARNGELCDACAREEEPQP